jgi:hypothetical protein
LAASAERLCRAIGDAGSDMKDRTICMMEVSPELIKAKREYRKRLYDRYAGCAQASSQQLALLAQMSQLQCVPPGNGQFFSAMMFGVGCAGAETVVPWEYPWTQ